MGRLFRGFEIVRRRKQDHGDQAGPVCRIQAKETVQPEYLEAGCWVQRFGNDVAADQEKTADAGLSDLKVVGVDPLGGLRSFVRDVAEDDQKDGDAA